MSLEDFLVAHATEIGLVVVLVIVASLIAFSRHDRGRELTEAAEAVKADESEAKLEEATRLLIATEALLDSLPPFGAEATAWPYWGIVEKGAFGKVVLVMGFWDSREAAEEFLRLRSYRFGKNAFVFCFSGMETDRERFLNRAGSLNSKIKELVKSL